MVRTRLVIAAGLAALALLGAWWLLRPPQATSDEPEVAPQTASAHRTPAPERPRRKRWRPGDGAAAAPAVAPVDEPAPGELLVTCDLDLAGPVPATIEVLPMRLGGRRIAYGRVHDATVTATSLSFQTAVPEGGATVRLDGYDAFAMTWRSDGSGTTHCVEGVISPEPAEAWIDGRVALPPGTSADDVVVFGCKRREWPLDDGRFSTPAEAGPCELQAWRRAGALSVPGPTVRVQVEPGERVSVVLDVPAYEPAGMGISIESAADGIRVEHVFADTPAWDAGLRDDDLIVAVDGVGTAGLSAEEFVALGTGPEGSEVVLDVAGDDGPEEVRMVREYIPAHPEW